MLLFGRLTPSPTPRSYWYPLQLQSSSRPWESRHKSPIEIQQAFASALPTPFAEIPMDLRRIKSHASPYLGRSKMRKCAMLFAACLTLASSVARAQVDLSAYTDANGFIDVQALTCAQLANTWQQDADMLSTWYSGWYNGLAKKHYLDVRKGKETEHEVICTARRIKTSGSLMPSLSFSRTKELVSESK
jgi:hypothetical protein